MAVMAIRSLESGDDGVLAVLATDAADFELSDNGDPLPALDGQESARYLSDSSVIHWVAFDDGEILGSLVTIALPLPISPGVKLLLYERAWVGSCRRCFSDSLPRFRSCCYGPCRKGCGHRSVCRLRQAQQPGALEAGGRLRVYRAQVTRQTFGRTWGTSPAGCARPQRAIEGRGSQTRYLGRSCSTRDRPGVPRQTLARRWDGRGP